MAIDFSARAALADGATDDAMLSEINTTPLVDVMLVLLIIFLITIPVVNAAVSVRLPKESNVLRQAHPGVIVISVDASGDTYWHDAKLGPGAADPQEVVLALTQRLRKVSGQAPQPEVHIRGDARSNYAAVARVLYACQQAGITRIGFITEPPTNR